MLESGAFAIAAITIGDVNTDQGQHHIDDVFGSNEGTAICGKSLVSGRSTEGDAEGHALAMFHGLDANVIGILDGTDQATSVKGNIEFARQIVEFPMGENV